jgi:tetratricopeptide (TPR) repeat protein
VRLLVAFTLLLLPAPTLAQDTKADALRRARLQAAAGKTAEAKSTYAAALAESPAPRLDVEARLELAALLAPEAKDPSRAAEIDAHYRAAIAVGSSAPDDAVRRQVLRAHNDYAAFLLAQGRGRDAQAQLKAISAAMTEPGNARARPRYLYNAGQAAESTGDEDGALAFYQQASALDPSLLSAAQAASRLALASPPGGGGIRSSAELVGSLMRNGALTAAGEHMKQACRKKEWASDPSYTSLATTLAEYLAAAQVDRRAFRREWHDTLLSARAWSGSSAHGVARDRLDGIIRLYEADLPARVLPAHDCAGFWAWCQAAPHDPIPLESQGGHSPAAAISFSRLARVVADDRARAEDRRGALARYALAWSIFPESSEAGLYLASFLIESRDALDPRGELLDLFVSQLLHGKGQAYLGRDWPNVLRLHMLLGTIFERRGLWGPAYRIETASFQWEHALRAHERLRETGEAPDLALVPGLNEKLATAYQRLDRPTDALEQSLRAGEGFAELGQLERARISLERARDTGASPTAKQTERLVRLARLLQ